MTDDFSTLDSKQIDFIARQKIFFVATAARDGHINLSPKGHDTLRVIDDRTLLWLNLTGSANETAAHLIDSNRLTLMWCSFEGPPKILRVYGSATTIHPRDEAWHRCAEIIEPVEGARQYFEVSVDLVHTSCGYAVPILDFVGPRDVLTKWTENMGKEGIQEYWGESNQRSLDGLPTHVLSEQADNPSAIPE